MSWMEFCRCNDFRQFFHIDWFDIDNVWIKLHRSSHLSCTTASELTEALVADVEIPQINPQVVRRNVCLLVGIHRDRMNVISMSVCIDLPWDGRNNIILLRCAWKSQKASLRRWKYSVLAIEMIRFGYNSEWLFKNFPKLYGFVWRMASEKWGIIEGKSSAVPFVDNRKCGEFCRLHHLILFIFSSISRDFR
jgi:hypothetical protein